MLRLIVVVVLMAVAVGASAEFKMPVGAIIAFDAEKCPSDGWSEYSRAAGRFLIGYGIIETTNNKYDVRAGDTGGAKEHSHEGKTSSTANNPRKDDDSSDSHVAPVHGHTVVTDTQENFPPFVAVIFCRYDGDE